MLLLQHLLQFWYIYFPYEKEIKTHSYWHYLSSDLLMLGEHWLQASVKVIARKEGTKYVHIMQWHCCRFAYRENFYLFSHYYSNGLYERWLCICPKEIVIINVNFILNTKLSSNDVKDVITFFQYCIIGCTRPWLIYSCNNCIVSNKPLLQ